MGLVDIINGSTDASQVDVVTDGDAAVAQHALAWLADRKPSTKMPWALDPEDLDTDEDEANE